MHFLTKTTYLHAVQCHKRLWLARHKPQHETPTHSSVGADHRIRQGQEVGRIARAQFPGGVLIHGYGPAALRQTRSALERGASVLFEAAFEHDGIHIRCDILQRLPDDTWAIIEVKSSSGVRSHYLHDLAIQSHVARQCNLPVTRLELMHINTKTCTFPHLHKLFRRVDVTARVHEHLHELPATIEKLRALVEHPREPSIHIGKHCNAPHACPFQSYCWEHVPEPSIFTIPRLAPEKQAELVQRGILDLRDIPDDFDLTPAQRAYVEFIRRGKPRIDRTDIRRSLRELCFPLYFFDFETYSPAVPHFDGMRPYQNYPFQYSCHVLHADGRLEHREYLHETDEDPRQTLARRLVRDLGDRGSVIAYHASFERGVLGDLAQALPAYAPRLKRIQARLWDQLTLIRRSYDHPRFLNSKSIKRVLPVLVPDLSYADLNVRHGEEAQIIWRAMLATPPGEARAQLAADLRAYCARDTYAMVRIHEVLTRLA